MSLIFMLQSCLYFPKIHLFFLQVLLSIPNPTAHQVPSSFTAQMNRSFPGVWEMFRWMLSQQYVKYCPRCALMSHFYERLFQLGDVYFLKNQRILSPTIASRLCGGGRVSPKRSANVILFMLLSWTMGQRTLKAILAIYCYQENKAILGQGVWEAADIQCFEGLVAQVYYDELAHLLLVLQSLFVSTLQ